MKGHTPGPWTVREHAANLIDVCAHAGVVANIARWSNQVAGSPEENRANARLITAAPELLKALKLAPIPPYGFIDEMSTKQKLDWLCSYLDWYRGVHDPAIAKAEGR